jgi:hypothetical protein
MNCKYIACALLAALSATPALANEQHGWVYNGLTGLASVSEDQLDDRSFGSNSSIGYRWGVVGVEVGYASFGKFKDSLMVGATPVRIDSQVDGWNAGVNFNHTLNDKWSLQGRVGMFGWNADGHVDDGSTRLAASDSGKDWYAGASIDYNWRKRSSIGLGYTRFKLDDAAVNLVGMHSEFRF